MEQEIPRNSEKFKVVFWLMSETYSGISGKAQKLKITSFLSVIDIFTGFWIFLFKVLDKIYSYQKDGRAVIQINIKHDFS